MPGRGKYKFEIVFEDDHLVVVNKPAGLLTVPIPNMHAVNLQEMVQKYYTRDVRPAHRIDRYTSGIVVFARNKPAHEELKRQFLAHEPQRLYLALTRGIIEKEEDTLVHYLKKVKRGFRNVPVKNEKAGGTRAVLHYQVLERFQKSGSTLVLIALDTGLKNQIRVQFKEIGHPLIGDRHYAAQEKKAKLIDRQALHAAELTLIHPKTGKSQQFTCDPPDDLKNLIAAQR